MNEIYGYFFKMISKKIRFIILILSYQFFSSIGTTQIEVQSRFSLADINDNGTTDNFDLFNDSLDIVDNLSMNETDAVEDRGSKLL